MKITRRKLIEIIKESLEVLFEENEDETEKEDNENIDFELPLRKRGDFQRKFKARRYRRRPTRPKR